MKIEIDKIFNQAFELIRVYCEDGQTPEEFILQNFPFCDLLQEDTGIFEYKIRFFEIPIYLMCFLDEEVIHVIVASKKDAIESNNFVIIDELQNFLDTRPIN